jgi:predicted metal-binding membrane protein
MLMALMFAAGAMSVATMALIAVFILAERVLPGGAWVARAAGCGLLLLGGAMMS